MLRGLTLYCEVKSHSLIYSVEITSVYRCSEAKSCGVKQGLVCVGVNTSESPEERYGGQFWLITVVNE